MIKKNKIYTNVKGLNADVYAKTDLNSMADTRRWYSRFYNYPKLLGNALLAFSIDNNIQDYFNTNKAKEWYGDITIEEIKRGITKYPKLDILNEEYKKFRQKVDFYFNDYTIKRKLHFSDSFGNLSMTRVMQRIFYVNTYYSNIHQQTFPSSDVYTIEPHHFLKTDNTEVELRKKISASSEREKVFTYFPNKKTKSKSVNLFVIAGANADVSAQALVYNAIAPVVISELLEANKIKVRIFCILGSKSAYQYLMNFITIKDFAQRADKNKLAIYVSDPAYFRTEGFKHIIALYDDFEKITPDGLGSLIEKSNVEQFFENTPFLKENNIENAIIVGNSFSEYEAEYEIEKILPYLTKQKK